MTEQKSRLRTVVAHWLPRMHAAGLAPADLERVIAAAGDWSNWCRTFCDEADRHLADGAAAERQGRAVTAGEAYLRAALFFHFGQFMFFDDLNQKRQAAAFKIAAYRRAAPLLLPPVRVLEIPWQDDALFGHLRLPGAHPAAAVVLVPGSDSTKEEFSSLERYFLERGLATFSVDGLGQGQGRRFGPLVADWRDILVAVRERLAAEPAIDADRIGIMGMAFGGHLVLQGRPDAAGFKAIIAMNGFFDLGAFWNELPVVYRQNLRFALGGDNDAELEARARRFSLAAVDPPSCPLLVIHGGRDTIFMPGEADLLRIWCPQAQVIVYVDGNHVCNNIAYRYRALMADWMSEALHR